ncbi:glycosyltransferase family 2 protein [Thermococcus sp. LS2]|uniref:glycosyltransferase family 2 protein n=1 Tax=Thermococcus sp. LS2 TaxID=1638260 RepID=UPI00351BB9B6
MFPRVSIIILNWNGWRDTIECLESLYRITYLNYDVIVIDNGSRDNSIQKIREYCEGKIKVNSEFFKYSPYNKPIRVFEISEDEAKQGKFDRSLYEKFEKVLCNSLQNSK